MNPLIQLEKAVLAFIIALTCFGLSPMAQGLLPPPPPDGGYPNQNTAEGDFALFSLTSGTDNTGSIDIESNKPPDELLTLARAPQRRSG